MRRIPGFRLGSRDAYITDLHALEKSMTTQTIYQALNGEAGIRALVRRFYALMDELPEAYSVRRIHPDSLEGSAQSLFEHLSGWFGGPPLYIEKNGHPRLRQRHLPYSVRAQERDEWMLCMTQALSEQVEDRVLRDGLIETIAHLADHMVNTKAAP
jgi:hemoglobin